MNSSSKIKSLSALKKIIRREKHAGKKIVFTNGCFDVLHAGHVRYLEKARSLGGRLVVALNRDRSVRRLKGPGRPVNLEKDRAEVISALACVDHVVFFGEDTPEKTIRALCPDVLVKGGDWKKSQIVGARFVESCGGRVVVLPYLTGRSTTGLLAKIARL